MDHKRLPHWRKLGLIFAPDRTQEWSRTHASLPTPLKIGDGLYRVFFSSRDADNRSHVGYFDVDLRAPVRVVAAAKEPLLVPGPIGHFDEHGIYASSAVRMADRVHLYTIGWNRGARRPLFYASIGLAISDDGGASFAKYGSAPIMARSDHDPCLVTAPTVHFDNDQWRMWYVSGYRWEDTAQGPRSHYHIKYAHSDDGIHWNRDGLVAIDHVGANERNVSRACVVNDAGSYRAWYGYAADNGYRIGYALSDDGLAWTRHDDLAGIGPSPSGWDSQTISYPAVVAHDGKWFMFYNGNGFGTDGIGIAVADRLPTAAVQPSQ